MNMQTSSELVPILSDDLTPPEGAGVAHEDRAADADGHMYHFSSGTATHPHRVRPGTQSKGTLAIPERRSPRMQSSSRMHDDSA